MRIIRVLSIAFATACVSVAVLLAFVTCLNWLMVARGPKHGVILFISPIVLGWLIFTASLFTDKGKHWPWEKKR